MGGRGRSDGFGSAFRRRLFPLFSGVVHLFPASVSLRRRAELGESSEAAAALQFENPATNYARV